MLGPLQKPTCPQGGSGRKEPSASKEERVQGTLQAGPWSTDHHHADTDAGWPRGDECNIEGLNPLLRSGLIPHSTTLSPGGGALLHFSGWSCQGDKK